MTRTALPTVASLAPAEPNYGQRALMSNFLELAIQGRRLATSKGLRPMAFCGVVEAGDLPMPTPRKEEAWGGRQVRRCRAK